MATDYEKSGFAASGERLKKLLESMVESDETIKQRAEAELKPDYESARKELLDSLKKESAQAAQKEKALASDYEERRQQVNDTYDKSHKRLENELNARGLGRSSLVATEGTALENERNRELSKLSENEDAQKKELQAALTEKEAEVDDDLQALSGSYAAQLEKRIASLKDSSRTAQVSVELQLAALQQQGYEAYMNNLMKEKEFAAEHPEKTEAQAEVVVEAQPQVKQVQSAQNVEKAETEKAENSAVKSAGTKLKEFLQGLKDKTEKTETLAKTKPEKKVRG